MKSKLLMTLCGFFLLAAAVAAAEMPEPEEIVAKAIAAAGGPAFAELEVVRFPVSEENTQSDGQMSSKSYVLYVDMADMLNYRLELEGGIVLGNNGGDAWATQKGVYDERPQTPYMAKGTINQTVFPLLLPYSLKMKGVWVSEVGEITWDDREAWTLTVPFAKGFFVSPVLTSTWRVVVAKDDFSVLAADFLPPVELRNVEPLGMRYRTLKYDDVKGAKIPSQILAVGINFEGFESGGNRITKLKPTDYGSWEPGLFVNPVRLEAMEGE